MSCTASAWGRSACCVPSQFLPLGAAKMVGTFTASQNQAVAQVGVPSGGTALFSMLLCSERGGWTGDGCFP